jgi:hypothetical protein
MFVRSGRSSGGCSGCDNGADEQQHDRMLVVEDEAIADAWSIDARGWRS